MDSKDDAAYIHIGNDSRMPTETEYQELINACTIEWMTAYNDTSVNGYLFTLKTDSTKTLFFPASGNLTSDEFEDAGYYGFYWSSSLDSSNLYNSMGFSFDSLPYSAPYGRCNGFSVRAVKPKS